MNLYQSNIPFLVLNVNLKTGLIAGVLGVSLVTGTITLVNNHEEINKKIRESVDPVISFLNPYFTQFQTGAINIGSKTKDWGILLKNKPLEMWTWLEKNVEFSKITAGASQIQTKLSDWYPSIKNFAISTKNWLLELDYEKLKNHSRSIYTTVISIYKLIDQFTTIFTQLLEKFQKNPQEVNAENSMLGSLSNIMQSENGTVTLQSLVKTFFDNSNRLGDLGMEDIAAVFGMASSNGEEFNKKVKELSEKSASSSGEKWGQYSSKEKFLEELGLKYVVQKSQLVQQIIKITQCPKDKECGSDYNQIITDFFDSIKEVIQGLNDINNKDQIVKDLTIEKYLETSANGDSKTKQIIDAIVKSALNKSSE